MKNKSVIIAIISAIVMLAGCGNRSDSAVFDTNEPNSSVYTPSDSGGSSKPISEPASPTNSSVPSVSTGSGNESSAPATSIGSNNTTSGTAVSGTDIGLEAAKAAALNHAGIAAADASFTEAKREFDDGRAEYDIEFTANAKHYEYEISAADGTVLEFSSQAIPEPTGLLPEARAKELALAHYGFSENQVTFTKCKLDYDNGISEYEIEFTANGVEYEVDLNAKTGEILKAEIDRD